MRSGKSHEAGKEVKKGGREEGKDGGGHACPVFALPGRAALWVGGQP